MDPPIPSFWRIWFATIDPIIASTGILGNIFTPDVVLGSYSPKPIIPPALETTVLLETSAGFFAGIMFLQVVLLRLRSRDVTVWKCVQLSIFFADIAIIASVLLALNKQGRLDPSLWRWEEVGNLVITTFALATRVFFILGVGMPQNTTSNLKWE
jgi:hypothetical protein